MNRNISLRFGILSAAVFASLFIFNSQAYSDDLPFTPVNTTSSSLSTATTELNAKISSLEDELKANPDNVDARSQLAAYYIQRGADISNNAMNAISIKKAANDFRRAIFYLSLDENLPDQPVSEENLKIAQDNLVSTYKALRLQSDRSTRLKTAKELRGQGKFIEAIVEYTYSLDTQKPSANTYGEIADTYYNSGRYYKAAESYEKALGINPDLPSLHLKYARALDKIGNYDTAVNEYNLALNVTKNDPDIISALEKIWRNKIATDSNNAASHLNLGVVLQKKGDFDGALEEYKAAELIEPNNIATRLNIGTLFQDKGDLTSALQAYDSIIEIDPNNALVHYYKATALKKTGDLQGAITEYQNALAIDPSNETARTELFETVKSTKSSPQEVMDFLKKWADNNPNDAIAQYNYAFEAHKNKLYDDASMYYQKAMTIKPDFIDAYINLASLYNETNHPDYAKSVLADALKVAPDNVKIQEMIKQMKTAETANRYKDAVKKHEEGKYQDAIADYLDMIKNGNATTDVYTSLGAAYQSDKKFDLALDAYQKALNLDKANTDAISYMADIYTEQKKYDKAMAMYNKILLIEPENEEAKSAIQEIKSSLNSELLQKALNEYNSRKYALALTTANTVIKNDPKNPYAYYYAGLSYDALNKYALALQNYQTALKYKPDFNEIYYSIAVDYDILKKYPQAVAAYKKFVAISKNNEDEYVKYSKQRIKQLQGK